MSDEPIAGGGPLTGASAVAFGGPLRGDMDDPGIVEVIVEVPRKQPEALAVGSLVPIKIVIGVSRAVALATPRTPEMKWAIIVDGDAIDRDIAEYVIAIQPVEDGFGALIHRVFERNHSIDRRAFLPVRFESVEIRARRIVNGPDFFVNITSPTFAESAARETPVDLLDHGEQPLQPPIQE